MIVDRNGDIPTIKPNGVVTSEPSDTPVRRVTDSEKRRLYTFAERKLQLEQQIVAAQLVATESAIELKDVNAKYAAVQQEIAARFEIAGTFQVTPDGVVIVPEPS